MNKADLWCSAPIIELDENVWVQVVDGLNDLRWMVRAKRAAADSKALNAQVGSVIVRDNTTVSDGYNGPPRGIEDHLERFTDSELAKMCSNFSGIPVSLPPSREDRIALVREKFYMDPRYLLGFGSGEGLDYQIDAHAEANSIVNAARIGVSVVGASLYVYATGTCLECTKLIINSGVSDLYVVDAKFDYGTPAAVRSTRQLLAGAMRNGLRVWSVPSEQILDYERKTSSVREIGGTR